MSPINRHIIFDLDGTLIDSSDSILDSFASAFEDCGIELKHPLTERVIGPPLMETISLLSGINDTAKLELLAKRFKANYDSFGYLNTKVYKGVSKMLESIMGFNIVMYVATNKRIVPTLKIINHFGWDKYFKSVVSSDSIGKSNKSKQEIIWHIIKEHNILNEAIYIGDTEEDMLASNNTKIPFVFARWGYGSLETDACLQVSKPDDIINLIRNDNL